MHAAVSKRVRLSVLLVLLGCAESRTPRAESPGVEKLTGSKQISGSVVDTDGKGLAGTTIRALRRDWKPIALDSREALKVFTEETLEEALADSAAKFHEKRARLYTAVTDAQGSFTIANLPEDSYWLTAHRDGFRIEGPRNRAAAGDVIKFAARRIFPVPVQVLMPDGQLATDAIILFGDGSIPSTRLGPYKWSCQDPILWLPEGDLMIAAVQQPFGTGWRLSPDRASCASPRTTVRVDEGEREHPVTLKLAYRNGIRGRVAAGTNADLHWGIEVYMLPWEEEREIDLDELRYEGEKSSVRPGDEYAFGDLAPGRYLVGIGRHSGHIEAHELIDVRDGYVVKHWVVPEPGPPRCIEVRLHEPSGEAVTGAEYFFGGAGYSPGTKVTPHREDEQAAWLVVPENLRDFYYGKDDRRHSFFILAKHSEWGPVQIPLEPGQELAEANFEPPVSLNVVFSGLEQCLQRERLALFVEPKVERGRYALKKRMSAEFLDLTAIDEVDAGVYPAGELRVSLGLLHEPGSTGSWRRLVCYDNVFEAGDHTVTVEVPKICSARIEVGNGREASVTLRSAVGQTECQGIIRGGAEAKCNADGVALLEDLVEGTYDVVIRIVSGQTSLSLTSKGVEFSGDNEGHKFSLPALCDFSVHLEGGFGRTVHLQSEKYEDPGVRVRWFQYEATCDARGVASFENIPSGTYELEFPRPESGDFYSTSVREFKVDSELETFTVPQPQTCEFVVRMAMREGANEINHAVPLTLTLIPAEAGNIAYDYKRYASVDADGYAKFEGVPAGEYLLKRYSGIVAAGDGIRVQVPGDELVIEAGEF